MRGQLDLALTLVSAPAGYGKTSLLVDLCREIPFPTCWLSLDESDQDFCALVRDLLEAIQRCFPDFGAPSLRALESHPDFKHSIAALCNAILQDLADHVPEFFVLVVDDYHAVDETPQLGGLLGEIALRADGRWHVIVSSRTIPGYLPSIDLLAQELMAFVSQDDLAFNNDEVQQYLKLRHDLDLTPEQAEELVASSEGWITGIVLATISVWSGIRDVLDQARAQDGPIYTYLADCAFAAQPEALRDTMLLMSTLPEMNANLCRQALGLEGAKAVLLRLEQRGIFLTKIEDAGRIYYRYHHLFRNFLQERLRDSDPGRFRRLHSRAAAWCETQGHWDQAVAHRRAAADEPATAQTMELGAKAMYLLGRLSTLISWYESLSPALRPRAPRLQLFVGRALIDLDRCSEALPLLHQCEAAFRERVEMEPALAAVLQRATVRYVQGRYAEMLDIARESLVEQESLESNFPVLIAEAHRLIGFASLHLGMSEEAVNHLQQALDLHQDLGTREISSTYVDLSLALLRLGRLEEGWACQDKAVELYRSADSPDWRLAMILNNIACERYYLTGDYGPALDYLRESLDVARATGSPRAQAFALLSTADLYRDLGALQEARRFYAQADELARQLGQTDLLNFALLGVAQTLAQTGELLEAQGLAAQARDRAEARGDTYQLGLSYLALGDIRLEAGEIQAALEELERGREELHKSGARRDLTRAYALLARAQQAAGEDEAALQDMRRALDVGIETQTYHHLVIEGRRAFDLLQTLSRQNPADRRPAQIIDRILALPDTARELVGSSGLAALPQRPSLRFYALGRAYVEQNGQLVELRSAQARRVLFYLLTHLPRSREQLFALFWPDKERADAKQAFHNAKYRAHQALGRAVIAYEDGFYSIAWDPNCWFDVQAFESLLDGAPGRGRQARLEEAVALYRGDFMEGYDAEWCVPIRERLQMRYRDALVELGQLYTEQNELSSAVSTLNQAVAADNLYEPAVRALMQLYVRDSRPGAALDAFQQLERQLGQLRAFPEQKTRSLRQSIQAGY